MRKRLSKKENQKYTRGKEKVVKNRRPPETAPGHSQKIEGGDENELERKLRLEKVVANKQFRLAGRRKKKEEQNRRMMQLPNGSDRPWRRMKKEKQDWRRW